MKNFRRVLQMACRYRFTLLGAILSAVGVAVLWGGNIGAVYPFAKIVLEGKSIQNWVADEIDRSSKAVSDLGLEIQETQTRLAAAPRDEQPKLEARLHHLQTRLDDETLVHDSYVRAKPYLDRYLPNDAFQTLILVMVVTLIGTVLKGVLVIANNVLVARLSNLATFDLRKLFYRRTLRLDLATFNDEGSSDLMSRFTHDTANIGNGLETVFGKLILEPLKMIACLVGAALVCWRLLLLSLIVAPAAVLAIRWLSKMLKRANRRAMEQMVQIFNVLEETFRGIKIVKAFTGEPYERRRFHLRSKEYYRKAMKIARYDSLSHPITEFMGILTVCLALLAGTWLVLKGQTHLLRHPAGLAAVGPQFALAVLRLPLRHGRSGAEVLGHLQPAAMRRGGQRPGLCLPRPRAGHPQPEEPGGLPAASPRAFVSKACRSSTSPARGFWTA